MADTPVAERPSIVLEPWEIEQITNGLTQPAAQLKELHRQGYALATRPRGGKVVLTRLHFEAVQAGQQQAAKAQNARSGPNVVGLKDWAKKRGTQAQGR